MKHLGWISMTLPLALVWGEAAGQAVGAEDVNLSMIGAIEVTLMMMEPGSRPLVLLRDRVLDRDHLAHVRETAQAELERFVRGMGLSVALSNEVLDPNDPVSWTKATWWWVDNAIVHGEVLYIHVKTISYSVDPRGGPLRFGTRTSMVPMVRDGKTWVPDPTRLIEEVIADGIVKGG